MRLAILGNGFLADIIVEAAKKGMLPDYELVGILGRSQEKTKALAKKADCEACFTITELLAQKPDIVAEAASVAASLASVGSDAEHVQITSVPGFVGDDHRITAEIDGVKAVVDIYSSTSAIAGWSVVALLQNLASPIVF